MISSRVLYTVIHIELKQVLIVALTTHEAMSLRHKFDENNERQWQVIDYRSNVRLLFTLLTFLSSCFTYVC